MRERQVLGAEFTPELLLHQAVEFLDCTDTLIDRCFETGDYLPLSQLAFGMNLVTAISGAAADLPDRARLDEGSMVMEAALTKCARYKVAWQSETRVRVLQPGNALGEEVVRGKYAAELSYKPIATEVGGGRITGDGPAEFLECSSRLISPTDFLSSTFAAPCIGLSNFEAEITGMALRRAAAPAVVQLRGSVPGAWVDWTMCWKVAGCETHKTISGGALIFVTYQHAKYQPGVGVLGGNLVVKNLKEPMGNPYPILFQGHIVTQTKIVEGDWRDESEITIEHIGRR